VGQKPARNRPEAEFRCFASVQEARQWHGLRGIAQLASKQTDMIAPSVQCWCAGLLFACTPSRLLASIKSGTQLRGEANLETSASRAGRRQNAQAPAQAAPEDNPELPSPSRRPRRLLHLTSRPEAFGRESRCNRSIVYVLLDNCPYRGIVKGQGGSPDLLLLQSVEYGTVPPPNGYFSRELRASYASLQ
jgi:hypothetical protein